MGSSVAALRIPPSSAFTNITYPLLKPKTSALQSRAGHCFLSCSLKGKWRLKRERGKQTFRASVSSPPVESGRKQCSEQTMKDLVSFLEKDLPHLFDEQGIDKNMYDSRIEFRDPITRYESLEGYLFNIKILRFLFRPSFFLHGVKQTGPNEITTRWTMVMNFQLLPWNPELVFTGTSVLDVNPQTGKFCRHVDYWDSIRENDYFSFEGFLDVLKQLRIYKTPDLETPKYQVLKRTMDYESLNRYASMNLSL
eukprot:TRINITY_DN1540_c0_g1_i3.p1 TRINITY_DN1540_c0_g1~~TRINITY_DN1540_c0_g1_i3.p1  ORF type:complete len:252 (-),score=32.68 TRINITY_DN1540_c0_g1_i3:615-1370(-)